MHCVAGLGRAPFFVAIALVNNGCSPSNAIELIRKNRPGALNLTQANYILEFKGMKTQKKNGKAKSGSNASCQCNIFWICSQARSLPTLQETGCIDEYGTAELNFVVEQGCSRDIDYDCPGSAASAWIALNLLIKSHIIIPIDRCSQNTNL